VINRVLNSQAPNVQVIADAHNHVHNKAAIHTNSQSQAREHERDLVHAIAQSAGPAEADARLQDGTERVDDAEQERQGDDVLVRELGFGQVRRDHLTDRVGVQEADEEDERHEVGVQDLRVQGQVGDDEGPGAGEGEQAEEGVVGSVAAGAAGFEDVLDALVGVDSENHGAVQHVEVAEVHGVGCFGEGGSEGDSKGGQHGLLPVAAAAFDGCDGVDDAKGYDALDGTGYQAEGEGVGVVLIPGLDVEGQEGCENVLAERATIEVRKQVVTNSQRVPAPSSIPGQSSWRPRTEGFPSSCSAHRHRGRRAHPEGQIVQYGVCCYCSQY
jgi:hypothetical protein